MIEKIHGLLLLIAVVWPLLLAIPALHSRLPWPHYLALVPPLMLLLWPGDNSLVLSWFLFGTEFGVDGEVRWVLGMTIVTWLTAAFVAESLKHSSTYNPVTTFFLLTFSGNLGVVLATDLVGFFSFSTLMGYGFYGLLIHDGNEEVRQAGRLYLIFLIVADLLLFEALLLAASNIGGLRYEVVRQLMAETSSSQFYLYMVLIGFALKAGIWPLHLWLSAAFNSGHRLTTLLLAGVPVAMGLLGAVRWLPFGEHAFYVLGMTILIMGMAAMLYAVTKFFMNPSLKILPAWSTVAIAGLFVVALGTGLAHPTVWSQYEYLKYPYLASMGIFLTALIFVCGRLQNKPQASNVDVHREEVLILWVKERIDVINRWAEESLLRLRSHWGGLLAKEVDQYQRIVDWEKPAVFMSRWSVIITLLVLLGLALVWLVE